MYFFNWFIDRAYTLWAIHKILPPSTFSAIMLSIKEIAMYVINLRVCKNLIGLSRFDEYFTEHCWWRQKMQHLSHLPILPSLLSLFVFHTHRIGSVNIIKVLIKNRAKKLSPLDTSFVLVVSCWDLEQTPDR